MKKIVLSIITLLVLITAGYYFYTSDSVEVTSTSANPDYICKKAVTDAPCNVTSYSPWVKGKRTGYGTKTTEVSYHLVRTTCESGYTRVKHGSSTGNSGRQGADYVSGTSNCSIVEIDTVAPTGKISE